MLISYLTHLIRRLAGDVGSMESVSSKLDAADLQRFISQRDGTPEDQRERYVQAYVAETFHFGQRELLPKLAAKKALTQALLVIETPEDFVPALREAAAVFSEEWFLKNGASSADKWMRQPEYWLWYWLRMGGAVRM